MNSRRHSLVAHWCGNTIAACSLRWESGSATRHFNQIDGLGGYRARLFKGDKMGGKIVYVAMLYCMALAMLVVGGINLVDYAQWRVRGHAALMQLNDPDKKLGAPIGGYVYANVKYVEANGQETLVLNKPFQPGMADRLAHGDKIPMFFQLSNPMLVIYSKDDLDSPWVWLILGVLIFFVARFAKKLLTTEAQRTATARRASAN